MNDKHCPYCFDYIDDDQARYWHIQVHNAKHEKENLDLEYAVLNKEFSIAQKKEIEP